MRAARLPPRADIFQGAEDGAYNLLQLSRPLDDGGTADDDLPLLDVAVAGV